MTKYKKRTFKKLSPRTPGELMKSIAGNQLHAGSVHYKNIAQIQESLSTDLDETCLAILTAQSAALTEVSNSLLKEILDNGSKKAKAQSLYAAYASCLTTTLRALASFKTRSVTSNTKIVKSPAEYVLEISNNKEEPEDPPP